MLIPRRYNISQESGLSQKYTFSSSPRSRDLHACLVTHKGEY
jgi:hypothetical protein